MNLYKLAKDNLKLLRQKIPIQKISKPDLDLIN